MLLEHLAVAETPTRAAVELSFHQSASDPLHGGDIRGSSESVQGAVNQSKAIDLVHPAWSGPE